MNKLLKDILIAIFSFPVLIPIIYIVALIEHREYLSFWECTIFSCIYCTMWIVVLIIKYKKLKKFELLINDVKITFDLELQEILETNLLFKENFNNGSTIVYRTRGKVFGMDEESVIFLTFQKEKLKEISIKPGYERLNNEEYDIKKSYLKYNEALKKTYDRKYSKYKKSDWEFLDANMKHYLCEHFIEEEALIIKSRKR